MLIRKISVSGFGHFYRLEIDNIPPGLTLIEGANEAGKTTLMAFIRAIFFGFADRRSNSARYEPCEGGEHGGSIILEDVNGETYRVERKPGSSRGEVTIYHADQVWHGDGKLKSLLKGLSERLFQQIFCFGLEELQRLDTLDNEDVSSFIYSVGMGSHVRSYTQIQKELNQIMGDLYRPAARKPEINRLLKELTDLDERIYALPQIPVEYNQLHKELQCKINVIIDLDQALSSIEKKELWLQSLLRASEPFHHLKMIEFELQQLSIIDTFPEDGVTRLQGLKDQLRQIEGQLEQVQRGLFDYQRELAELQANQKLLPDGPRLQELYTGVKLFQERLKESEHLKLQLMQRQREVEQFLAELGPRWSSERVQNFPLTFNRREKVREFATSIRSLETEKKALDLEGRQLLQWKEERDYEYSEKEREWGRKKRGSKNQSKGTRILIFSGVISLSVLVSGAWLFFQTEWIPAILLIIIAGVFWGGGTYLRRFLYQQGEEQLAAALAELEERQRTLTRIESQLKDWERKKQIYQQQKTNLDQEWQLFLSKDQLPIELKPDDYLDLIKLIEKGKEILRQYDEVRTGRDHLIADLQIFSENVNQVLTSIQCPAVKMSEVGLVIYQLQAEYEDQLKQIQQLEQLLEKCRDMENKRTILTHQRESLLSEQTQLLLAGSAKTEEEFRTHSQLYQKRQLLLQSRLEWETAFQMAAVSKEEKIAEALENMGSTQIENDLKSLLEEKQAIKEQLDLSRHQQGRIEERLDQLETSEELSLLRQERESLVDEIRNRAEEWMTASFCQSLLELAKERYEKERQPSVLKEASLIFSELTNGRYQRVLRSLNTNHLEVEKCDQKRLSTAELSRGTAEQLYLAMRFALVKEFAKRSVALPMIMDDILVNFDPYRTKNALEVMAKLASEQQIIFFTCHTHLAEILEQAGIQFNHIKLTELV